MSERVTASSILLNPKLGEHIEHELAKQKLDVAGEVFAQALLGDAGVQRAINQVTQKAPGSNHNGSSKA